MNNDKINRVASQWVRLGAMFNVAASEQEVDVERLLLDTARHASANSRLLTLAVTWLAKYGQCIAVHRLAKLIQDELEAEHKATMGLILDLAKEKSANNSHHFNRAIAMCERAAEQRALFDVDNRSDFFRQLAQSRASALSRKWGRWVEDFQLKDNVIRPASWVVRQNPSMQYRADFGGGLRASVLAELKFNPLAGESESALSRACGSTRAAVLPALERLEMSGRIRRQQRDNRIVVELAA